MLDGHGLGVLCSLHTGRSVASALDGSFAIGGLVFGVYRVRCSAPLGTRGEGAEPRVVTLSRRAPTGRVRFVFAHTVVTARDLPTLVTNGERGSWIGGVHDPDMNVATLYAESFTGFQTVFDIPPTGTPTDTPTNTTTSTPTDTTTSTSTATNTPTGTPTSTATSTATPTATPAPSTCALAIGFFAPDGTSFGLRTGDLRRGVLLSYMSVYGPGGLIRAIPQVPRAGVPDTLTCAVDTGTTIVNLDVRVASSTNPAIARGAILHVLIVRGAGGERVTVTDRSIGAVRYSLTPMVAPQTFRIAIQ